MPVSIDASQFVGNFLNTYFAVKQSRDAEKQKKYEPIIAAVMDRIKSDDTTYTQKTALTKSLFQTLGIKTDESVSQLFSEIENQDKQLVKTKEKVNPVVPTNIGSEGFTDIEQARQKNVALGDKTPENVFNPIEEQGIKRGDLTPYEYKELIKQKSEDRSFPRELAKRRELIKLESEATIEQLKIKGFKDLGLFKDKDGSWFNLFSNPLTGDERRIPLPKDALPESVVNKQIQAQSSGIGGLAKQLSWAYGIKAQAESDPNSVTAAQVTAADEVIRNQQTNVNLKQAQTTVAVQTGSGTRLVQPGEKIDNEVAAKNLAIRETELVNKYQTDYDEALSEAEQAAAQQVKLQSDIAAINAELAPGKVDEDKKSELIKRRTALEDDLRAVQNRLSKAQGKGTAALNALNKRKGQSTNTGYNATQLEAIKRFKQQNANNPKLGSLNDDQILQLITQAQSRGKKTLPRRR
jgi:hypothetical protein